MYQVILGKTKTIRNVVGERKKLFLIGLAVILIIAGGFGIYKKLAKAQSTNADIPTVTVEKGDVIEQVSATGTIQASTQIKLNFSEGSAKLTSVRVKVGQHVKKGEILATLDDREALIQLANARANLESAKARLLEVQQGATPQDLAVQQTSIDKAYLSMQSAKMAYETQKLIYDDRTQSYQQVLNAQNEVDKARIQLKSAQANLDSAKARLNQAQEGPKNNEIDKAEADVRDLTASVDRATYLYETAENENDRLIAEKNLDELKSELKSAEDKLDELKDLPDANSVIQAQAAVDQAQAALDQAQLSYNSALQNLDLANKVYNDRKEAKNQLDQAKFNYEQALVAYKAAITQYNQLKAPPKLSDLKSAQAAVKQAETQLEQQQLAVDNLVLKAPFDGVIAQVNASVGETTQGVNPFIVLNSDTKEIQVMAQISQSDIGKIKVGQKAEITTSTYQDKKFSGQILIIYPEATTTNGVTSYNALISVNDKEGLLRPGMTASVVINSNIHKDVLYIPTVALKEQNGIDGVYVMNSQGRFRFKPVKIGIFASDKVEIASGLEEGEKVALRNPADTVRRTGSTGSGNNSNSGSRSGGPSPFGGMGMGRRGF